MKKYLLLCCLFLTSSLFAQQKLTEAQKIEHLIQYIAHLEGCKFIRNGSEYAPAEAADHLRLKLKKGGNAKMTAKEFIDKLASESSMSGKPYQLKWTDGKVYIIKPFLVRELERIDKK